MRIIEYELPYMVYLGIIPANKVRDMCNWNNENTTPYGYRHSIKSNGEIQFYFRNREDAIFFELAWG